MPRAFARRVRLEDAQEERRRLVGGRMVAEALERLPPPAPEAVGPAACRAAEEVVWRLARMFRVARWDWAEFRRALVRGALRPWRPGTEVREDALAVRVRSDHCPFAEGAAADPRVCAACQAFLAHAVALAAGPEAGPVAFEELASRGDPACSLRVPRREDVRDALRREAALAERWKEVAR